MNYAIELINDAASQGIKLTFKSDTINCKSANPIPPGILAKLKENKPAVLQVLKGQVSDVGWLKNNAAELKEAEFTDRDIQGQGWFVGLVDLNLLNKPGLRVELRGDQLCFTWQNQTGNTLSTRCFLVGIKIP